MAEKAIDWTRSFDNFASVDDAPVAGEDVWANTIEEWDSQYQQEAPPQQVDEGITLGDVGTAYMQGSAAVAEGIGGALEYAGQATGLDTLRDVGTGLRQVSSRAQQQWAEGFQIGDTELGGYSDAARGAQAKKWFSTGEEAAWKDPAAWALGTTQALPSLALSITPAGIASKLGASAKTVAGVAAGTNAGLVGGGVQANIAGEIERMTPEQLDQIPGVMAALDAGMTYDEIKQALIAEATKYATPLAAAGGGITGYVAGPIEAAIATKVAPRGATGLAEQVTHVGRVRGTAMGAGVEAVQEGIESGPVETGATNLGLGRPLTQDMAENTVQGMAIGMGTGGALGFVSPSAVEPSQADNTPPEQTPPPVTEPPPADTGGMTPEEKIRAYNESVAAQQAAEAAQPAPGPVESEPTGATYHAPEDVDYKAMQTVMIAPDGRVVTGESLNKVAKDLGFKSPKDAVERGNWAIADLTGRSIGVRHGELTDAQRTTMSTMRENTGQELKAATYKNGRVTRYKPVPAEELNVVEPQVAPEPAQAAEPQAPTQPEPPAASKEETALRSILGRAKEIDSAIPRRPTKAFREAFPNSGGVIESRAKVADDVVSALIAMVPQFEARGVPIRDMMRKTFKPLIGASIDNIIAGRAPMPSEQVYKTIGSGAAMDVAENVDTEGVGTEQMGSARRRASGKITHKKLDQFYANVEKLLEDVASYSTATESDSAFDIYSTKIEKPAKTEAQPAKKAKPVAKKAEPAPMKKTTESKKVEEAKKRAQEKKAAARREKEAARTSAEESLAEAKRKEKAKAEEAAQTRAKYEAEPFAEAEPTLPANLRRVMVEVPAKVEGTDEVHMITVPAREALDYDAKRIAVLKQVIGCLLK